VGASANDPDEDEEEEELEWNEVIWLRKTDAK
jgi:hypothetical protein